MITKIKDKKRLIVGAAFTVWCGILLAAMVCINKYSATAGPAEIVPPHWPAQSLISPSGTNLTLVMFAFPRCPCTRATLGELELLMAGAQGRISAHVFFLKPEGTPENWAETDLWRKAATIPGVVVHLDRMGVEARRFHSLTSGDTQVYGSDGRLLFQGGITISRGHYGDNDGTDAINEILRNGGSKLTRTPVFGCGLFDTECKNTALK